MLGQEVSPSINTDTSMEETEVNSRRDFTKEVQEAVRQCTDVLITICVLFGFDLQDYDSRKTISHYFTILKYYDGNWMKMFKDKLASFRAYHCEQELPVVPCPLNIFNPAKLFGGRLYRWMRKVQRTEPDKFMSLIISLCQAKKGMPRPPLELVEKSVDDTFDTLTGARVQPAKEEKESLIEWGLINDSLHEAIDISLNHASCERQLRRTVVEIFKNEEYTSLDRVKPYFPSSSANYNNTRSRYGIVGMLVDEIHAVRDGQKDSDLGKYQVTDPSTLVTSIRSSSSHGVPIIDETGLLQHYERLYAEAVDRAMVEVPSTELVGLQEALKVRVISKGPPYHYFVMKPLQKFLWKTMKKHKMFQLIGKTVSEDIVQDVVGSKLKPTEVFLSVDYSDATNQIRSWASEIVVDEICKTLNLTDSERKIFTESMTKHEILNRRPFGMSKKAWLKSGGKILPQNNGQLMGSVVSFPILCIINACILRWTQELSYQQYKKLDNCNACVNGDDGLLKTVNGVGDKIWAKIATYMGLKPSLGKVFKSRTFLDINSTNYTYNPEGYECRLLPGNKRGPLICFKGTPYINSGLLLGVPRSTVSVNGNDKTTKERSFGSVCHELLAKAPHYTRERVYTKFLKVNKEFLDSVKSYNIPWFVPEDYGGLGLPIMGEFKPTDLDLRLMRKFVQNPHIFKIPGRPKLSWRVWDYVDKRMRALGVKSHGMVFGQEYGVTCDGDNLSSVETLEGLLAIESIFTIGREIFPDESLKDKDRSYLKILGRFWSKLIRDKTIKIPEPLARNAPFPIVRSEPIFSVRLVQHDNVLSHCLQGKLKNVDLRLMSGNLNKKGALGLV